MQEMLLHFLGGENHLKEEMATHCSILAWKIPWTEEPGGYSPWGYKESNTTERPGTLYVRVSICKLVNLGLKVFKIRSLSRPKIIYTHLSKITLNNYALLPPCELCLITNFRAQKLRVRSIMTHSQGYSIPHLLCTKVLIWPTSRN